MPRDPKAKPIRSTAEFADYVGLARTTVSRVLNGQPGLRKKTIERVQRAMAETGFSRNAFALHLRGKRTASIGICMESLMRVPAVYKLAALQRRLREKNYTSFVEVLDSENMASAVSHFLSLRVEAVAFIGYFEEREIAERIGELSRLGVAHVLIDHAGVPGAHTVALDRRKAMEALTRHLIALGHTRFGLLGISEASKSTWDRLEGIRSALVARGLSLESNTLSFDHLHPRTYNFEFGRLLAKSFSRLPDRPTAYLSLNDDVGAGAIRGFTEEGVRVPADVSVTGFNNQDLCLATSPQLTTVDQQVPRTIEAAVTLLFEQFGASEHSGAIIRMIDPEIVVRESTGPVRN